MYKKCLSPLPTALSGALKTTSLWLLMSVVVFGPLSTAAPAQASTRYEAGISTSATLLRMNDADLDARLNDIQRLGATWIRIDFSWPAIQPTDSHHYDWAMYDRIVRVAGAHHLKILALLDYTPRWAQEPRCAKLVRTLAAGQKCNPASNKAFARFTRAAALRYKHKSVRAWEIWNEPNLSAYWKTAQAHDAVFVDPQAYAALANAAAWQIRHNDPDSVIITGGLAPLFEPIYPKGMRQSDYLARLLPYLSSSLFDGVGIHPYSWPVSPSHAAIYNAFYTLNHGSSRYNLQTIMARAGWRNKQLWGTEFGAPTLGSSTVVKPTANKRPDHVNEAVQARIIRQGMVSWHNISNTGPLFVHSDTDQGMAPAKSSNGFGLRRKNGVAKPAYRAFQSTAGKN